MQLVTITWDIAASITYYAIKTELSTSRDTVQKDLSSCSVESVEQTSSNMAEHCWGQVIIVALLSVSDLWYKHYHQRSKFS